MIALLPYLMLVTSWAHAPVAHQLEELAHHGTLDGTQRVHQARLLRRQGKPHEALHALEGLGSSEALLERATCWLDLNAPLRAQPALTALLALGPSADAYGLQARWLATQDRTDEAFSWAERAFWRHPTPDAALQALAYAQAADAPPQAAAFSLRAAEHLDTPVLWQRASEAAAEVNDGQAAQFAAQQAAAHDPSPRTLLWIAQLHLRFGSNHQARWYTHAALTEAQRRWHTRPSAARQADLHLAQTRWATFGSLP